MSAIKITSENYNYFPPGTKVRFNFGAMFPTAEGVVTGVELVPPGKWNDASVRLLASYRDPETGERHRTTIETLSDVGIGVSVIEVPEIQIHGVQTHVEPAGGVH